jgi:hypothetical protein
MWLHLKIAKAGPVGSIHLGSQRHGVDDARGSGIVGAQVASGGGHAQPPVA